MRNVMIQCNHVDKFKARSYIYCELVYVKVLFTKVNQIRDGALVAGADHGAEDCFRFALYPAVWNIYLRSLQIPTKILVFQQTECEVRSWLATFRINVRHAV